jgi:BMFP domain-containing protein YqiC
MTAKEFTHRLAMSWVLAIRNRDRVTKLEERVARLEKQYHDDTVETVVSLNYRPPEV